jgi:hypothetical protein
MAKSATTNDESSWLIIRGSASDDASPAGDAADPIRLEGRLISPPSLPIVHPDVGGN